MTRKAEQCVHEFIKQWRANPCQLTEGNEEILFPVVAAAITRLDGQLMMDEQHKQEAMRNRGRKNGRPPIIQNLPSPATIKKMLAREGARQMDVARDLGVSIPTMLKRVKQG